MRPIHWVLRLSEDGRAGLAVLAHGIVEGEAVVVLWHAMSAHVGLMLLPALRAIGVVLGYLRGEVVEGA